ncbi:MAG: hypothetical protein IPJ18_05160 [Betaproteobacteria bacterium]|nr:hypothetical protein [Betaproteobacteria bacterium]
MNALSKTANAWRKVHDFTSGLSDEEFEQRAAEAQRLRDELLAIAPSQTTKTAPVNAATTTAAATATPSGVVVPVRPATLKVAYEGYAKSKANIAGTTKTAYGASVRLFAT